jgi:aryl-alcohol dehydrogenase-like predicted oxidoreductase
MKRRDFLKTGMGAMVTATVGQPILSRAQQSTIPKRTYKDDVELSLIGFGGIVVVGMEQPQANRAVAESFERGVNYFDVAPSYGDGEAEEKLGKAIQPYRDRIFLACKTQGRDAKSAEQELEVSLNRIGVDHFDLYQFHAVTELDDVKTILGPSGAMETFHRARQAGKIRYIGFSAHSVEAALALLDGYDFDSVLFPLNFVCVGQGNFGPQIVEKAKEKGAARLALKAMAHTARPEGEERTKHPKCWYRPVEDDELAERALRFTLSHDITAAIPPGEETFFFKALDFAPRFKPLSEPERKKLLAETTGKEPIFRYSA